MVFVVVIIIVVIAAVVVLLVACTPKMMILHFGSRPSPVACRQSSVSGNLFYKSDKLVVTQ